MEAEMTRDYLTAEIPPQESERLQEVHRQDLIGMAAEPIFQFLVNLAATIYETPIAFFSFVDKTNQLIKASVGLELTATARETAICAHTILRHEPLVIPDALADARFTANPLVSGSPHIRFYAGAPVRTGSGFAIGTLCVASSDPRPSGQTDCRSLAALAQVTADELELRLRRVQGEEDASVRAKVIQAEFQARSLCENARYQAIYAHVEGTLQSANASFSPHAIGPFP
jgi:GAF domain-containing protein